MSSRKSREKDEPKAGASLVDCFTEIMTYTLYLIQGKQENNDFAEVEDNYRKLLERSKKIAQSGKIPSTEWKKGFFPVCAWVDEKILCSDWPQRGKWKHCQLQVKHFQTANAGREFFSRLEKLKDSERDVREVYTYCLSLGFQGQHYSDVEQMELSEIRAGNFLKFFSDDQDLSLPEELFPYAYQHEPLKKKPRFRRSRPLVTLAFLCLPPIAFFSLYSLVYYNLDQSLMTLFGIK
ncbi:MAG: DotU family type IV/VI secretion system protein [Desulfohalobiaceae bacterium]|nr:DotU family type IV/VI secretion system protein [Desulfohalobiaceae bacterium]